MHSAEANGTRAPAPGARGLKSLLRTPLWTLAILASTSFAQDPPRQLSQYSQRLYRTEQGLPQNDVRSIAQTPDGYLWFATRDGLARFDGVKFSVYRKENTPGIGHTMLGALLVDHLGRLWIATGDGLSKFESGRFKRYSQSDGLPSNAIHSLLEDHTGKLWIGTWNGLASFDGRHFQTFSAKDGLPNQSISGLAEDGDGGLWVGTFGGGLAHLAGSHFRVLREQDGLPSNVVFSLLRDRSGRLWVGTLRGCAVLTSSGRFKPVQEVPGRTANLYEDRAGNVWAVSDKVFARLPDAPNATFRPERAPSPSTDVETVFEDREGTLWIGTTSGAMRYRAGSFTSYTKDQGLASDSAQTIFEDSKGALWIGTDRGLNRWSHGTMQTVAGNPLLGDGLVNSLAEDDAGRLWVGTPKGVSRFDGQSWTQMRDIQVEVHVLYRDRSGRMWVGSPEGVLIWDHGKTSRLTQKDGLPGNYVMSIVEDRQGTVWLGTITGLARLDHGKITAFGTSDGLLSNYIQCLYSDEEGTLWIGTPSGLHRFRNGRFRAFTEAQGMYADNTLRVLEDNQRRFWLSSFRGIFQVGKDDLNALADGLKTHVTSFSYGPQDGIKSPMCAGLGRQPAGGKTSAGIIWFPTDQGVVSVDPARLARPDPPPVPVLDAMLIDGAAAVGAKVGPDIRRIEFSFTAPTSVAPESIEFRYRMQGFEDQWREAGTQRLISFTNLPPGNYRFAVSARRRSGEWSTQEVALALAILPHFYETKWFYMVCGLLAMVLLWSAHSFRVRQTERRLQAVMAERSRVAQELHDTLLQSLSGTAMQIQAALRRLRQGSVESGFEQLSVALVHLGKSMADARQAIWGLKTPELEELPLDRALEAAAERVCAGGPRLVYAVSGNSKPLGSCLEQHVYRIGVEAITNAVRHSGCTEIAVDLEYRELSIVLRVRDDGCGFHTSGTEGQSPQGNHWGLTGIRARAKQCAGDVAIQSAPGAGTDVRFEAPILQPVGTNDRAHSHPVH